jgi:uncharacterized protein (TIGR03086 family)
MPIDLDVMTELDRRAVRQSIELVQKADSLDRPTPCAEWDLQQLLTHMAVQHRGFAAAAAGLGADPAVWEMGSPAADPVADYVAAAEAALTAFTTPAPTFALPELGGEFPAARAISFHLVDYVVHGWDVARSLGLPFEPDPEAAEVAFQVVQAVPTGAAREVAGAAFAPPVPTTAENLVDRMMALLGRSPTWPA